MASISASVMMICGTWCLFKDTQRIQKEQNIDQFIDKLHVSFKKLNDNIDGCHLEPMAHCNQIDVAIKTKLMNGSIEN